MKRTKGYLGAIVLLSMVVGLFLPVGRQKLSGSVKPAKPVISLSEAKNGTAVNITINSTSDAEGYLIYMKSDINSKYKKIKTLKKDGTVTRNYTVKNLSKGIYSFKVKAYLKENGKTVKGSFSTIKVISLDGEV